MLVPQAIGNTTTNSRRWTRLDANSQGHSRMNSITNHIRALDIRFSCKEDERRFVRSREQLLIQSLLASVVILMSGILIHVVPLFANEFSRRDQAMDLCGDSDDSRNQHFYVSSAAFVFNLLLSMVSALRLWKGWFQSWNWEALVTAELCINIFFIFTAGSFEYHGSWEMELNPKATELNLVLVVDTIMTAACLFLPVRICLLWLVPGFALLSFVCLTLAVGLQADTILPHFVLFALGTFSLTGSFRHEQHMRKDWLSSKAVKMKEAEIDDISALKKGLQTVAETMCDLVIKLSDDLAIQDISRLHSYLGLGPVAEPAHFIDLLTDVDAERFRRSLGLATRCDLPQCLGVALQRGSAGAMEVQLLIVDVGHPQLRFLIGIQKCREELVPIHGDTVAFPGNLPGQHPGSETEISFHLSATTASTHERQSNKSGVQVHDQVVQTERLSVHDCGLQVGVALKDSKFRPAARPPRMDGICLADGTGRPLPPAACERRARPRSAGPRQKPEVKNSKWVILSATVGKPVLSDYSVTKINYVSFALQILLRRINPCGVGCCPFHLGVESILTAINSLGDSCKNDFRPFTGWQCLACQAMNEEDDEDCMVCFSERE